MPFPRSRVFQYALLLLVCGGMAVTPLVNHFDGTGTHPWPAYDQGAISHEVPQHRANKDYPLWYFVGRTVVEDRALSARAGTPWPLYPTDPNATFPFMYPPFAALCLGLFSLLGPTGMLIALIVLNVACAAVAIELSVRLVGGGGSVWVRVVPAALCLFFLNDMFMLGQPNLGLLGLILGGLTLDRTGKPANQWLAGGLFALATALKAFPAVVIVYLLWRRRWRAAAGMVAFSAVFFLVVPAAVRGPERSLAELKTWADGMLFRQGESGHGQRPEQSVGYRNQSLFGVANRFLRPGNAKAEDTAGETMRQMQYAPLVGPAAAAAAAEQPGSPGEPLRVNVVDLGYRGAMVGAVVAAGLLGLGFVLLMPRKANRTRTTDAAEFGMLVILMTVGTPYAFGYYFVWLLFPLTVLVRRGMQPGGWPAWAAVGAVAVLFAASGLVAFDVVLPMALGSLFWAAAVALAGCGWVLWDLKRPHPPSPSP